MSWQKQVDNEVGVRPARPSLNNRSARAVLTRFVKVWFIRRWVFDLGPGLMAIPRHINYPLRALRNE
jgi:hypothetical protein